MSTTVNKRNFNTIPLGYAYGLIAYVIFSTMGILTKEMGKISGNVLFLLGAGSFIAGVALYFQASAMKVWRWKLQGKYWGGIAAIAIFCLFNNLTLFLAYDLTTIGIATLTHYLAPVVIVLVAPFVLKERITLGVWLVVIFSITGLVLVLNPETLLQMKAFDLGIFYGLLSAIFYGLQLVLFKWIDPYVAILQPASVQFILSGLVLIPIGLIQSPNVTGAMMLLCLMLGFIYFVVAVNFQLKVITILGSSVAGIMGYLDPIFASLWDILFFGTKLTGFYLLGAALIIGSGIYLVVLRSKNN